MVVEKKWLPKLLCGAKRLCSLVQVKLRDCGETGCVHTSLSGSPSETYLLRAFDFDVPCGSQESGFADVHAQDIANPISVCIQLHLLGADGLVAARISRDVSVVYKALCMSATDDVLFSGSKDTTVKASSLRIVWASSSPPLQIDAALESCVTCSNQEGASGAVSQRTSHTRGPREAAWENKQLLSMLSVFAWR